MIPRTTAGRALLDAIATNERLSPSGLRMAEYRQAAAAIEREALAEGIAIGKQQERDRIRAEAVALSDAYGNRYWRIPRAILADNSPSASAEPDGEPSDD